MGSKEDPALQRSAVGRAYYAVFNLSRDYAESRGAAIPNFKAHKTVWDTFARGTGFDSTDLVTAIKIAGHGRWLSTWRQKCDYDDVVADLPKTPQGHCSEPISSSIRCCRP